MSDLKARILAEARKRFDDYLEPYLDAARGDEDDLDEGPVRAAHADHHLELVREVADAMTANTSATAEVFDCGGIPVVMISGEAEAPPDPHELQPPQG